MNRMPRWLAMALMVVMIGCAGKSTPTYTPKYYPECYEPIAKLEQDESNAQEVKGTVVGATLGALGGALIGGLATGRWEGAVAGAVVGGVGGGIAGYYKAHLDKIADQEQRLAEYQNMLGQQSAGWDLQRASVEKAYQCYSQQMDVLKNAVMAKQISRDSFRERMAEIKTGLDHINTYWAKVENRMDSFLADGDAWLQAEDQKAAANAAAKKRAQAAARKRQQVAQNTKKSNANTNALKKKADTQYTELALLEQKMGASGALGFYDEEELPRHCRVIELASN